VKLWHLQDRKFKRPVAELRLKMACLHANKSPLHRACAELLTLVVHDATTETCYLASVCELGNSMKATDYGFTFRVNGFDDKLLDLTDVLLKVIFGFNTGEDKLPSGINPSRFDACLEILFRRYNNDGMRASGLSSEVRLRCIRPTTWSSNEKVRIK
jgi:nardilysin